MTSSSKQSVGRGAAYIYIENIVALSSGYVLWLALSKITTSGVIGIASTVVSLAAIFSIFVTIGIPNGVPRFLGKSFSERNLEYAKLFVKATILLVSLGIAILSVIILILRNWIFSDLDFSLIILSIVLMGSSAIEVLFRSIVISAQKTKVLVTQRIVSSVAKVVVTIILILMGAGALGITIGYTFGHIISSILLTFTLVTIFKTCKSTPQIRFTNTCKSILVAGIVSWIPALIATIGAQLGTVIVFGSAGASQAGTYFIAYSIFSAISTVTYSLLTTAFPVISAFQDGRKRVTWRLIKMSLVISIPVSFSLLFYSKNILGLIGQDYVKGSASLEILLLSMVPIAVVTGITTLVYVYGNYKQVLIIGLATNIPRTLLYFILVPVYDAVGAAMSITIGSAIGFFASIIIAKKIGMQLFWKDLFLMSIIPLGLAFILAYFQINYIIGIIVTIIISYTLFFKLHILNRSDIQGSLGILPHSISNPITKFLSTLEKKLNRLY